MLHPDIIQFIGEMKKLNCCACLLVPSVDREVLLKELGRSSVIVGDKPQAGRVTYYLIGPKEAPPSPAPPALFIATEEDYSKYPAWAEQIRSKAAYFFNVKSGESL